MTSTHTTMLGAFRLPDAYACEDLGWTPERLRNGFGTLSESGFIAYCPRTKWVWIVKFLKWNRPENPNQWKAVRKLVDAVPENCSFKKLVSETVLEPLNNTPVPAPAPVPVPKAESAAPEILDAYHAILPKCQAIAVMGPKRKRLLATATKQAKAVCVEQGWPYVAADFWHAYFTECSKDEWLRGDKANPNNPAWVQKIETLLDEKRFSDVMDRAIANMRAGQ
ncbi:MAG: hypothetical protein M3R16_08090 [Pseudomonadota bacterium]|nr:hypothetical protein [Pseudomonadota bacterium]